MSAAPAGPDAPAAPITSDDAPHFGHHHGMPVHLRTRDYRPAQNPFQRFNSWLGLKITLLVGTMICGYVFAIIALLSLPSAISSHSLTILIAWISSNFLQLVLLPIIIVGQNLQARASDSRAAKTFDDTEQAKTDLQQVKADLLTALDRLDCETEGGIADILTAVRALPPPPPPPVSMPRPPSAGPGPGRLPCAPAPPAGGGCR